MFTLLKNILFPKFCLNCNKFGLYICKTCQNKLKHLEKEICLYCEKESSMGETHKACQIENGVDIFITVFKYNISLKKVIANIKYRLVTDAFNELFKLMDESGGLTHLDSLKPFYVQPIPLHSTKFKQRGFNQSLLIANWLANNTNSSVIDVLKRVKETKTQATLNKMERTENAKGAFEVGKGSNLQGLSVILVDDVVTTGSTVKQAALKLKAAGVAKVAVFSIAKG